MLKRIVKTFSKPKNLSILNAVLLLIGIATNLYYQVFCIPSTWAIVFISICFITTIIYPFIHSENTLLNKLVSFVSGISFMLFLYCILFLGIMNIWGLFLILIGLGLITFIPHFLAVQLLLNFVIRPKNKTVRTYFSLGIVASLCLFIYAGIMYNQAFQKLEQSANNNYETIEKDFMTEKILGMGLIYHVRFCEYDGWRPPKHEPLLVLGLWFNQGWGLGNLSLEDRLHLYKKHYPNKPVKFDCSCAYQYKDSYHQDRIWD